MKITITRDHEQIEHGRIKDHAFSGRSDIEEVVVGDGITEIGKDAFLQCGALRKVVLPDGLMVIGDEAFHECPNLRTVNLPASLNYIGYDAFSDGGELDLYCVPRGVCRVREEAFYKGMPGYRHVAAMPCHTWAPCAGVARNMEITLHETGHFVALCATGLYDEFTLMTDQATNDNGTSVLGETKRNGRSLSIYLKELESVPQRTKVEDPFSVIKETFGKAPEVCLPHVCFFLGGGVIDDCFGTGSETRNKIDHNLVKDELLRTMFPQIEVQERDRLELVQLELLSQMREMVSGFLQEVFYREFSSVAKIARLLKESGTIDKRGTDGILCDDVDRIHRNAETEYAKLLVDFREWWRKMVCLHCPIGEFFR